MITGQFQKNLCRRNGSGYTCAFEFEGNVQEVGYRLKAWTIALGSETLQKGRLENLSKNRMRIYLTSKKPSELMHIYGELCRQENIPNNAEVSAIRQVDANGTKTLPAGRVTDILMLEQQSKGVDYLKAILGTMSNMNKNMENMNKTMGNMDKTMNSQFGKLPKNMAREIAKALRYA